MAKEVKHVTIKVTWEGILGTLLLILENGDAEGKKTAREELTKMAKAADLYNESIEKEEV